MLKLCVTFAAFFISLGRILWVSDDHCPNAQSFLCFQLLLHWQCTTVLITPFVSPSAWERRTQGAGAAGVSYRRTEGQESRDSSSCTERCSLAGDTQCILQNLWICSFLHVQTKITAPGWYLPVLHVKQSEQTFPSLFSLPPHLHVLLQTSGHELGWQLLRRGKVLYSECSITSKTCYFTVRGNS